MSARMPVDHTLYCATEKYPSGTDGTDAASDLFFPAHRDPAEPMLIGRVLRCTQNSVRTDC